MVIALGPVYMAWRGKKTIDDDYVGCRWEER